VPEARHEKSAGSGNHLGVRGHAGGAVEISAMRLPSSTTRRFRWISPLATSPTCTSSITVLRGAAADGAARARRPAIESAA
ncbi:MAG: hypothetical protein ACRD21_12230, partial [Vicinamibacteria bacterium]